MKNIEIAVIDSEKYNFEVMCVAMARMTQRGHKITNLADFYALLDKPYTDSILDSMLLLPHDTIKRFTGINIVVVGASRRFLAQVTRHQAGVSFMSGSLQYSDYTGAAQFTVPYDMIRLDAERHGNAEYVENYHQTEYLNSCNAALRDYEKAIEQGVDSDAAAYMMPQGLRNVLVISANPAAWSHMCAQRTCNRNTLETQYIFLRIWKTLCESHPIFFKYSGPPCTSGPCPERNFSCNLPWPHIDRWPGMPEYILSSAFPYLEEEK